MKKLIIIAGCAILLASVAAQAANKVYLSNSMGDTIMPCQVFTIGISIENSQIWKGMSLGFRIWSPDGAKWQWVPDPAGGYGAHKYVDIVSTSRAYPPESVWDIAFTIAEADVDGNMPDDQILVGGAAAAGGLLSGPKQEVYRLRLRVDSSDMKTLCIDSTKVGASGDFVFADASGGVYPPEIGWNQGGICWLIKNCACMCPSFTEVGQINGYCLPDSATLSASDPQGYPINWGYELISGTGTVSLANAQGNTNLITYTPGPGELSGTVKIMVKCGTAFYPWDYRCCSGQWALLTFDIHANGDVNNDGKINVSDAVFMINFEFKGGIDPLDWKLCDVNCDQRINVGDIVFLINHIFKHGPAPRCCSRE
jgi:hypothetical protein